MKIISALYDNPIKPYKEMAANMVKSLERLGYEDIDLRALNTNPNIMERPKDGFYMPVFMEKLPGIRLMMDQTQEDLFWIDVDCLVRERFDEMTEDCDMCFTIRRPWTLSVNKNTFDSYLNAGVFFLKNNDAVRWFLEGWIENNKKAQYGDQQSLAEMLLKVDVLTVPKTFEAFGCRIKTVPCDIYNHFYFDGAEKQAKILHFKGQPDKRLYIYWRDKILGEPSDAV